MSEDQPHGHGDDQNWDEIYGEGQVWSGDANVALVAVMGNQLAGMPAGRALDVGCGEGGDAIWLAEHGWRVTAIDVASGALERGRAAAQVRGAEVAGAIEWVHAGLLDAGLVPGAFNLVSVFYPALRKSEDDAIERSLPVLVAPGGALLVVAHDGIDREAALERGFDPDHYVGPEDLIANLPHGWSVERFTAERHVTAGRGAHHHSDVVVIARRDADTAPGTDALE